MTSSGLAVAQLTGLRIIHRMPVRSVSAKLLIEATFAQTTVLSPVQHFQIDCQLILGNDAHSLRLKPEGFADARSLEKRDSAAGYSENQLERDSDPVEKVTVAGSDINHSLRPDAIRNHESGVPRRCPEAPQESRRAKAFKHFGCRSPSGD